MRKRKELSFICWVVLALAAGCGGGAGSTGGGTAVQMSTRANDGHFSQDARILAARLATGPRLPADKAATFDTDLGLIRAQYPQVANIHTIGDFVLTDLVVGVSQSAPWFASWAQGTLATGDPGLDGVLSTYGAASVRPIGVASESQAFVVSFDSSLNIKALAPIVKAANASISYTEQNFYLGDGDRITYQESSGKRIYTLSHGWGDCPGGCISRHFWTFTFGPFSALSLVESGTPIPPDGGRSATPEPPRQTTVSAGRKGP
jgi:hypothetical protein